MAAKKNHKNPEEHDLVNGTVSAVASVSSLGVAVGAAVGTIGGLPGMIAGALVGGGIGALAGNDLVEAVNPEEEVEYWRINHKDRNYFNSNTSYDAFSPAYRFGIDSYSTFAGRDFNDIEPELAKGWENVRGFSRLTWQTAQLAARDAYNRLSLRNT